MTGLGIKMVIWFLVLTVAAGIICDLLDDIFSGFAEAATQSENEGMLLTSAALLVLSSILVYVVSGVIFFLVTRKAIRKESERQTREKDLIYAAVAHDLKTPMTSVRGFAKALSDGKVKPEEQQEIFDIICRKSDSMNDLVDTLFEYSKLGTGEYKPVMEKIDLCKLVRDIVAVNYTDLEEHGIEADIDIPDEEISINGDKNELGRALTNLVTNIYKHNPDGIKAKISVGTNDGKVLIRISDSGDQIPEGMDIFEPFVTENSSRTAGQGTGLGLAITRRIISRHNGSITLDDSEPGYTKTFVICFQIAG